MSVVFWYFIATTETRRGGEIGIHEGLKIPFLQRSAGSSPARGTKKLSAKADDFLLGQ
jgi:hypothetical protein